MASAGNVSAVDVDESADGIYGVVQNFEGDCDVRQITHEVAEVDLYMEMGQDAPGIPNACNHVYEANVPHTNERVV